MNQKLLLISDLVSHGKIALSAMTPILSYMKYDTYNIPTAVISNTFDYGYYEVLDGSTYLKNTLNTWKKIGFNFDAVFIGYMVSKDQTNFIIDYIKNNLDVNIPIFVDPIMGDDGMLYKGIKEEKINNIKKLLFVATYLLPNYTEACFLSGMKYEKNGLTKESYHQIIDILRKDKDKSVIITSAKIKGHNNKCTIGYDHIKKNYFKIDFDEVNKRYPGTGDIFSSIFMGKIMLGLSVYEAVKSAMDSVRNMILSSKEDTYKYQSIEVENYFNLIK